MSVILSSATRWLHDHGWLLVWLLFLVAAACITISVTKFNRNPLNETMTKQEVLDMLCQSKGYTSGHWLAGGIWCGEFTLEPYDLLLKRSPLMDALTVTQEVK